MGSYARERACDRVAALALEGLDLVSFWRSCAEILAPALPHHLGPCWFTLDPASLLVTSHFQEGLPEIPHEWLAQEYLEDDVNKMADVARSESGVATLHDATDGDPARSPRWSREIVPYGGDQEMLVALRAGDGTVWGTLGLYRAPGRPLFDAGDQALARALAPHLAHGARRALLLAEAREPAAPGAPGLLVVGPDWELESVSPDAARLLEDLADGDAERGGLPSAVLAVAGAALRPGGGREPATARVRGRSGSWITLHGSPLGVGGGRRAAVILEPAHPARLTPLLMAAHGLTPREQEVTRHVLVGDSTREIAAALAISPHTVQQHLKSVFEKTGVRSRRDLVAKVFYAHYEPRVRENERRVMNGRTVRGGPVAQLASR
jgi:DNA-binding CsgD family transcriptional regulator